MSEGELDLPEDSQKDNQKKDGQRKNTLQIINPLKKRRDTDEQDIDNRR